MNNQHGLDTHYFKKNLEVLLRDLDNYSNPEMSRVLSRLACVADPGVCHAISTEEILNSRYKSFENNLDIKVGDCVSLGNTDTANWIITALPGVSIRWPECYEAIDMNDGVYGLLNPWDIVFVNGEQVK